MDRINGIAGVTGATGTIGKRIVQRLLYKGYEVRVLTRNNNLSIMGVTTYVGDLSSRDTLPSFLKDVTFLFHCAGELRHQSRMWDVNVLGTQRLIETAVESGIRYICYVSSVGVFGKTNASQIDESYPCNPGNLYEISKFAAERQIYSNCKDCNVIVLRPTNVIDEGNMGVLNFMANRPILYRLHLLLKGREFANIVHADDVAAAALHFMPLTIMHPQCFIVSRDHEAIKTFGQIADIRKFVYRRESANYRYLPIIIPHLIRRARRGYSNRGDVLYSSDKLLSWGFEYTPNFREILQHIIGIKRRSK